MPRTAGCKCAEVKIEDVGLTDSSGLAEVGGPSQEFRFGFPCDGMARVCPRDPRGSRLSDRNDKGAGDDGDGGGWLSFFLKNLPKIFFVPLVGVELVS